MHPGIVGGSVAISLASTMHRASHGTSSGTCFPHPPPGHTLDAAVRLPETAVNPDTADVAAATTHNRVFCAIPDAKTY